ncbi:MAG: hypothetical protein ACPH9T_09010, partial [Paracoccaceae bacterium]
HRPADVSLGTAATADATSFYGGGGSLSNEVGLCSGACIFKERSCGAIFALPKPVGAAVRSLQPHIKPIAETNKPNTGASLPPHLRSP